MSEDWKKRMSLFGFELPIQGAGDPGEYEKVEKTMNELHTQYEHTKDILWCCLDGQNEGGEHLPPAEAFHVVTSEIHSLLVRCSELYRNATTRVRRLEDALGQERRTRAAVEDRAAQRARDEEAERRLRETRERCDRDVAAADEKLRAEQARAARLEERLLATEKELLVLRALQRAARPAAPPGPRGPAPYLNAAATAAVAGAPGAAATAGASGALSAGAATASGAAFHTDGASAPGQEPLGAAGTAPSTPGGGLSAFQVGSVSDYIFAPPGSTVSAPQTMQWTQGDGADGDLVARRAVFRKEALEDAVRRLGEEKSRLEDEVVRYGRIVEVARQKLEVGGLDAAELERLLGAASGLRTRAEAEQLRHAAGDAVRALELEREARAADAAAWHAEKLQLKKDWQAIYNQICSELQIKLHRYD